MRTASDVAVGARRVALVSCSAGALAKQPPTSVELRPTWGILRKLAGLGVVALGLGAVAAGALALEDESVGDELGSALDCALSSLAAAVVSTSGA